MNQKMKQEAKKKFQSLKDHHTVGILKGSESYLIPYDLRRGRFWYSVMIFEDDDGMQTITRSSGPKLSNVEDDFIEFSR